MTKLIIEVPTDTSPASALRPKMDEGFHLLYKTSDPDVPDLIRDNNGEVVLDYCRVCGRAEAQLGRFCYGERMRYRNPEPIFAKQTP